MSLSFLKDFKKKIEKIETISTSFGPPTHWYSAGNYALNNIISGSYTKGIPQSRITVLAGPSGCLIGDEEIEIYEMKTRKVNISIKTDEVTE